LYDVSASVGGATDITTRIEIVSKHNLLTKETNRVKGYSNKVYANILCTANKHNTSDVLILCFIHLCHQAWPVFPIESPHSRQNAIYKPRFVRTDHGWYKYHAHRNVKKQHHRHFRLAPTNTQPPRRKEPLFGLLILVVSWPLVSISAHERASFDVYFHVGQRGVVVVLVGDLLEQQKRVPVATGR